LWRTTVIDKCTNSPSVFPGASNVNGILNCEAVVTGGASSIIAACQDSNGANAGNSSSIPIGTEIIGSAPISVSGGLLYTGTNVSIVQSAILSNGRLQSPITFVP